MLSNQTLYEYIPSQGFVLYQVFPSLPSCADWDAWEINNEHYMSILSLTDNFKCQNNTVTNSYVYKWDQTNQIYVLFQTYQTFTGQRGMQ